jgi:hypothetical protein
MAQLPRALAAWGFVGILTRAQPASQQRPRLLHSSQRPGEAAVWRVSMAFRVPGFSSPPQPSLRLGEVVHVHGARHRALPPDLCAGERQPVTRREARSGRSGATPSRVTLVSARGASARRGQLGVGCGGTRARRSRAIKALSRTLSRTFSILPGRTRDLGNAASRVLT